MTITTEERLRKVHYRSLMEFDNVQEHARDERLQCLKDRRFYSIAGAQWEGDMGDQFANKPRFEFNKVHLAVIRIINEYRNNRISVDFTSKDGSENDKMADTCDGLYRADEQDSGAQEAYDNAFEEGVGGGFGAYRLRAAYEDEDDEENTRQRIRIEPIFDADSCVFFDNNAKRQDKADAKRCWVLTGYTRTAYEEEFGDDPATWPKEVQQSQYDWAVGDIIYVAEYYEIEKATELVHYFRGLDDQADDMAVPDKELQDDPHKLEVLKATGFREVRQKRVTTRKVHKYIMNGRKILEDCGYIAGKCIPIVPFYGKRWYVDGIERMMGHVRLARDAQMLQNMLMSWLAEMAARFDMEKPIVTPEQIAGHAQMWADDNIKKFPYLLLNPIIDPTTGQKMPAGPVAYTKAPNIPPAMGALSGMAIQALEDMLGNQQAGEQLQPNMSGKAVELIQNRLDMQVFIYMSNFAKSVKRGGEIWLSMAKDLLVEPGRKMKTVTADNKPGTIELMRPMVNESGETYKANDMEDAKFDVNVDVGPSSSSRRAATVRALTGMMTLTQDPETLSILNGMTMLNMEGEGISDVRDFFRKKLVAMGAIKPTDEEAKELAAQQQNQQPDPNAVYLQAAAKKALSDADLTQAKIGESHAKTIETLAGIESSRQADAITLAAALTPDAQPEQQQMQAPQVPQ